MAHQTKSGPERAVPGSNHVPVLVDQVIVGLRPKSGGRYLDATFGGGGHTRAILDASAPDGRVLAIDADPAAVARAAEIKQDPNYADRFEIVHGNFAQLGEIAREHGFVPLDGILLDLGLSSFQLETPERGFAFRYEGPLDMRFDVTSGVPASELVNRLPERELADLISTYGEEPRSRRIASAIVRARAEKPIETTSELASIVARASGGRRGAIHPATRTFQALRIATNRELDNLEEALRQAVDVLAPGGRLAVISFHSLEDRIVKRFIAAEAATCVCPPDQPVCTCNTVPRLKKIGGAIKPDRAEILANPRSRSAVLRIAERLPDPTDETEGR